MLEKIAVVGNAKQNAEPFYGPRHGARAGAPPFCSDGKQRRDMLGRRAVALQDRTFDIDEFHSTPLAATRPMRVTRMD